MTEEVPFDWPRHLPYVAAIVRQADVVTAVVLVEPVVVEILDLGIEIGGDHGIVVCAPTDAAKLAEAINREWRISVADAHRGG